MVDGKVQRLELASDTLAKDLTTSLETVGKMVSDGVVQSMAVIVTYNDGSYDVFWGGLHGATMYEKIGILRRLEHELLHGSTSSEESNN